MVKSLLERMERWLSVSRPDYFARLQPGASDARLDTVAFQFQLTLPATFRELYRWRNGQSDECSASLQRNRMFMSLDDVVRVKVMCDEMIGCDFEEGWWRRGWLPFLSSGGGSYLCLDAVAEGGGTPGQLVAFWNRDPDRPIEHPSVDAWLQDLVSSMEDGTLEVV